jgi:hypothetical protein
VSEPPWFQDRRAWGVIARGYLPWFAVLNLAWEAVHVRLYTLWYEADAAYIAFAVVHCTLGDVLIGACALLLALILAREGPLAAWRWRRIGVLSAVLGAAYTVFSEWMNISILRSWTYGEAMPTIDVGGVEIGLSPLFQWLVLPPLALHLARWRAQLPKEGARLARIE